MRRLPHRLDPVPHGLRLLVAGLIALGSAAALSSEPGLAREPGRQDSGSPHVAAFDRFAAHGDVDAGTGGRLLLSELSCTACHAADDESLQAKSGPRLDRVGTRLHPDWIAAYLRSPAATKPGTTMPDLLHAMSATEKEAAIDALVAYLGSRQGDFPAIKGSGLNPVPHQFWAGGDADRGRSLYHSVGCVACHAADPAVEATPSADSTLDALLDELEPEELEEFGLDSAARRVESVPLPNLADKYTSKSLTHFLYDPEVTRPSGRMPNLKLLAVEAADIAAYLIERDGGAVRSSGEADGHPPRPAEPLTDAKLIKRGRQQFFSLGCANCHETGEPDETAEAWRPPRAPSLATLDTGGTGSCLLEPAAKRPRYALTSRQVETIGTALAEIQSPAEAESAGNGGASESLRAELLRLNCYACHKRDQIGGVGRYRRPHFETVGNVDLGDEGRLPPPLSGAGRKLREPSLKKVLEGSGDVRPHMQIRMPRYPASQVETLPEMFSAADRGESSKPAEEIEREAYAAALEHDVSQKALAAAGRQLMDAGCVECHSFRGYALPGVVGIDLEGIADRVHPDWFHDFVLNPGSLKARTRMPTFFPDGQSQNAKVLDGDTELQLAAIWTYLKDLDRQPLPGKIEEVRSQDYELRPTERPIVLRTFMEAAGTHAIAVGFPAGVHIAFDAERVRLAGAWRGRFLDSQGTWFSRFAPPAEPLGEDFIALDTATPLARLVDAEQPWPAFDLGEPTCQFKGYRVDEDGVPTFRSRCGEVEIEDRIMPEGTRGLTRRLTVRPRENASPSSEDASDGAGEPVQLWFRALAASEIERQDDTFAEAASGLRVEVSGSAVDAGGGRIRETAEGAEWLLPLEVANELTLEVSYQW